MKLIDCSACIGFGGINREIVNHENYFVYEKVNEPADAASLLSEMDFCGIDGAAVYHQAMVDASPSYGNKRLLDELQTDKDKRLYSVLTWLPSISDDGFSVPHLRKAVKENSLFGIRLMPQANRYMLDRITCGDLLDYAGAAKLPVYLSPAYGWEYIFSVMKECPSLTVILTNYGLWGSDRYFYPLVNAYKNVYIDTSDYQEMRGIELFVRKFGSERMLFGTNYPKDNMGGPLSTLMQAKIPQSDRENIAHKNFERLYAEVKR